MSGIGLHGAQVYALSQQIRDVCSAKPMQGVLLALLAFFAGLTDSAVQTSLLRSDLESEEQFRIGSAVPRRQ